MKEKVVAEGLGAELYALGLLQSADNLDKDAIVLNTLYKGDRIHQLACIL